VIFMRTICPNFVINITNSTSSRLSNIGTVSVQNEAVGDGKFISILICKWGIVEDSGVIKRIFFLHEANI